MARTSRLQHEHDLQLARKRTRDAAENFRAKVERVVGSDESSWLGQILADGQPAAEEWDTEDHQAAAELMNSAAEAVRRTRERAGAVAWEPYPGPLAADMLQTGLPLNRKERYYTGTVLPMIVGSDDFIHLHRLLHLCGLHGVQLEGSGVHGKPKVQFYTEYSFAESVMTPTDHARFEDRPVERDTPDVVVVGPDWLLAIEAKVFHRPSRQALKTQMDRQRVMVDYWTRKLDLCPNRVSHVLLLPADLAADRPGLDHPVVTWEQVGQAYKKVAPVYWLDILKTALSGYGALSSAEPTFRGNADDMLTGEQIYERYHHKTLDYPWMGRSGGVVGKALAKDLASGDWRTRSYELRHEPLPGNPNWFPVRDFVLKAKRVDEHTADSDS